jgi:hypothetical protein
MGQGGAVCQVVCGESGRGSAGPGSWLEICGIDGNLSAVVQVSGSAKV